MELWKWLLIGVAAVGLAALAVLFVTSSAPPPPLFVSLEPSSEQGEFLLQRGDEVLGRETFSLGPRNGLLRMESEVILERSGVYMLAVTDYAPSGAPLRYQLILDSAPGMQILGAEFADTKVVFHVWPGTGPEGVSVPLDQPALIVEEGITSHLVVLHRLIRAGQVGRSVTVPRLLEAVPLEVVGPIQGALRSGQERWATVCWQVAVGDLSVVLHTMDGTIRAVTFDDSGLVAWRSDLLPEMPELIVNPAP